jgi:hypothetical protein
MPDTTPGPRRLLPTIAHVALASIGAAVRSDRSPELAPLVELAQGVGDQPRAQLLAEFARLLAVPHRDDERLVRLAQALTLSRLETLAVALALAVERDVAIGRALSALQHPLGGSRPTVGLVARALDWALKPGSDAIDVLVAGPAVTTGLVVLTPDDHPLPERTLAIAPHLAAALRGLPAALDGAIVGAGSNAPRLAESLIAEAGRHAVALARRPGAALAIRSGSPAERRAASAAVCEALGKRPLFLARVHSIGITPWLALDDLLPVFECELGPSERFDMPALVGYAGPRIVTAGPDGGIAARDGAPFAWHVPVPPPDERRQLWASELGDDAVAGQLAHAHRHGCGRIAELARLAKQRAAMDERSGVVVADVVEAAWSSDASGLEALAEPMRARIPEESLVLCARTQEELDLLLLRCSRRERIVDGLGVSATTRYRPGVRALFVGPSGSGKTLAVGWLASRLNMPLYRVDVASVVSKYIGETEKNLAQLLARAEDAEVALLFDEADSLFGKRTDVKHSNDRFANAQTNYLLQRIESYDGIALLTSNSRSRFDSAFTRRLDFIIEFPAPNAEERRTLWDVHLGRGHEIDTCQINRLAASLDLVGGHIRNAVLSAATIAGAEGRPIGWGDLMRGVEAELRKLGRQLPAGLDDRNSRIVRSRPRQVGGRAS